MPPSAFPANFSTTLHTPLHLPVTPAQARRLLLAGAALLHDPAASPTPLKLVRHLGFLQLDSINSVERAHELILHTRSDAYRPGDVFRLLRSRKLFEHWTHDASLVPAEFFPHWHGRFEEFKSRGWHLRRLGKDADATIAAVLSRIDRDGPLLSRHFDPPRSSAGKPKPGGGGGWWNWKPAKAALEYLWRTGQLAVADRVNFQKLYDLPSRTHPHLLPRPTPTPAEHLDFACRHALTRLGIATPKELAEFFASISANQARTWTHAGLLSGELIPVTVDGHASIAFHDLPRRIAALPDPNDLPALHTLRLLAPFDPLIRDRARILRLFNFHYRFEAFTPAHKRLHGYYVLPVLRGDQLVGRVSPKFGRKQGTLVAALTEWEPGVRPTDALKSEVSSAVDRLANFIGAARVKLTFPRR